MRPLRVLAVDGGGIRGIIPALVLAELERLAGRPAHALFDLMAGTSTGGIVVLALARPPAPLQAADVVRLYEQEGPVIFRRSLGRRIASVDGLIDEKYGSEGLVAALRRHLGEARLAGALTPVVVPAYETVTRRPFLFRSVAAARDPADDWPMAEAALATSAAPSYFEPPLLRNAATGRSATLIDGGVYAANPALLAWVQARELDVARPPLVLSLGTGRLTRPLPHDRIRDWGALEWARPLLDVIFDGQSDAVDRELTSLLGPDDYVRLQIELTEASDDLDDASPDNLRRLRAAGERLVARERARLRALAARLAA